MLKDNAASVERSTQVLGPAQPYPTAGRRDRNRASSADRHDAQPATSLGSRSAAARQCLFAHAQGVFDLDADASKPALVGAELLARWVTDNGTVLYPGQFLPLIDELDLSFAFDDRMLRTAAALLSERNTAQVLDFVAVNIGADHLSAPRLVDSVEDILMVSGIKPEQLVLEVTEVADHVTGPWRENITMLDRLGVQVAIDDFGSGFSSMARLIEAPVSIVKIDRTLIEHIDDPGCRALLSGLVAYATESGTQLIAEGIETAEQSERLIELGISRHQGYHYHRPAPLDQLRRRMNPQMPDWDGCSPSMAAAG